VSTAAANSTAEISRIDTRFAELRALTRAAFIPFITAGDPDTETSFEILQHLPGAGADLIELGIPFSDPMADGPAIQASSLRALKSGMTLKGVLHLVERFRGQNGVTPLVLMGYYNPIHAYGGHHFLRDAAQAGVDGLIIVDLAPEEGADLQAAANRNGIDIIRLAAPTTTDERLKTVLKGASGFLYYVSVTGVTGTKAVLINDVAAAIARIQAKTRLPCAVGFGIRTLDQAAAVARIADAAVVGSALVQCIAGAIDGQQRGDAARQTLQLCRSLSEAVHHARDVL
jgi:tryptophan synthase alpha chain